MKKEYVCERRETILYLPRVRIDLKHGFALKLLTVTHSGSLRRYTCTMFKLKHYCSFVCIAQSQPVKQKQRVSFLSFPSVEAGKGSFGCSAFESKYKPCTQNVHYDILSERQMEIPCFYTLIDHPRFPFKLCKH